MSTSIACEDQRGQIREITGTKLMKMHKNETIRLFPAKYQIRQLTEIGEMIKS